MSVRFWNPRELGPATQPLAHRTRPVVLSTWPRDRAKQGRWWWLAWGKAYIPTLLLIDGRAAPPHLLVLLLLFHTLPPKSFISQKSEIKMFII